MPSVMAAQLNIGGAIYESLLIPFLVSRPIFQHFCIAYKFYITITISLDVLGRCLPDNRFCRFDIYNTRLRQTRSHTQRRTVEIGRHTSTSCRFEIAVEFCPWPTYPRTFIPVFSALFPICFRSFVSLTSSTSALIFTLFATDKCHTHYWASAP